MILRNNRCGFALVSVLAILGVVGVVTLGTMVEARLAISATTHRTTAVRARWLARGCLADARAAIDAAMLAANEGRARDRVWRNVGEVLASTASGSGSPCEIVAEPAGVRADVNALDSAQLVRLFEPTAGRARATDYAASVLDWRDQDTVPRAGGAEVAWYSAAGRFGPGDRAFASDGELSLVKGLADEPGLVALLTTAAGPIAILHAPERVVRAVVGDDALVVENLLRRRASSAHVADLRDLLSSADTAIDRRGASAYGTLVARAVVDPTFWFLAAQVTDRATGLRVQVVHRLRRSLVRAELDAEEIQ
jgi:type II secretory pathway component PulK